MQSIILLANRQPVYDYAAKLRQLWVKSEFVLKYFFKNIYGVKPKQDLRYKKHLLKLRSDQSKIKLRSSFNLLNKTEKPLTKKWKKNFKNELGSLSFISLTLNNENDLFLNKLGLVLKKFENKNDFKKLDKNLMKLKNFVFEKYIAKGCNGVVYDAKLKDNLSFDTDKIAIKILYNYSEETDKSEILKNKINECLPLSGTFGKDIDNLFDERLKKLPKHPNIVEFYGFFVDDISNLLKSNKEFVDNLTKNLLNYGLSEMTLFIVMKKYETTLDIYLACHNLSTNQSLFLLSQLFKGVEHLNKNNIAHRDLKTNNILLDLSDDINYPWLVITDFGSSSTKLTIHYTEDQDKGGNGTLMAPEITCLDPGIFSWLNYSKSDLWACGAIAYEIFNNKNPFYFYKNKTYLFSSNYKEEDLPEPKPNMPSPLKQVVKEILNRDPFLRPEIKICSTVCDLLFFVDEFLLRYIAQKNNDHLEFLNKINLLSTNLIFCKRNLNINQSKLNMIFLKNLDVSVIREAFKYFLI